MLELHHLNNSRSQRILWLLEELGLEYKLVKHQRDPQTNLSPPSLKAVHPLGKAPVLRDGELLLIESGAIIEYVARRYGQGKLLAPPESSPLWPRHVQLMHFAEGSAMLPLMLRIYLGRLGDAGKPLEPRVQSEIDSHLGYLERELGDAPWFLGAELGAVDVQLSFVVQAAKLLGGLAKYPKLAAFLERIHARPAWKRGVEKGGPTIFA
jgi:glutathione S-transferase